MSSLTVACLVLLLAGSAAAADARNDELPTLEQLLARLARVSTLYADNALRFTCNETINLSGTGMPVSHKFKYIYRYSGEEKKLDDYRVLRGRKAKMPEEQQERLALANYDLPEYLSRAYSWVFLFDVEVQDLHRYAIEGEDEVFGRPAIRLRFEPIPPIQEGRNDWYGTALVDRESSQLLLVEAIRPEDEEERRRMLERKAALRQSPDLDYRETFRWSEITTKFNVEKHGMRFPGRVVIRRLSHKLRGSGRVKVGEQPLYEVIQTYDRYRFYSVRTAEQINAVVYGAP